MRFLATILNNSVGQFSEMLVFSQYYCSLMTLTEKETNLLQYHIDWYIQLIFIICAFKQDTICTICNVLPDLFRIFWITMWINVGLIIYMSAEAHE